ncbi:MAG: hypothetical protein MRERV_19c026 [Mycoplasmataceae bacterium RV_VA103A]|nr:MAG: hypothetical protein MRERV_19c026 [Mycoplasmataceae bacterium RV_VA103A]
MALNHAKSSAEKEEKIKHIQREAQEVREQLDKIKNVRKVSVEIQAKPQMKDAWVQTELTAEQITQMEADITKYQSDIQQEQNKVQEKETELANLGREIKSLQEQVQLNFAERYLITLIKDKTWWETDKYEKVKRELEALGKEGWKLHSPYTDIRTKLLELVNSLIEGKENKEQLEKRNKDLEEKLKDLEPNEAEKELLEIAKKPIAISMMTDEEYFTPEEIKDKLQTLWGSKWSKLRKDYKDIRNKLIDLADQELEIEQNQQTITTLTKNKEQLQTQLDLATKTKEELAKELEIEKNKLLQTEDVVIVESVETNTPDINRSYLNHYWVSTTTQKAPSSGLWNTGSSFTNLRGGYVDEKPNYCHVRLNCVLMEVVVKNRKKGTFSCSN